MTRDNTKLTLNGPKVHPTVSYFVLYPSLSNE